jgi:hypothetical protein
MREGGRNRWQRTHHHLCACLPSSIITTDLYDELIRCHRGEDSRITIERHRERRRNIEGRNLERDFKYLAPAREAHATCAVRPPSTTTGYGGVRRLHHISGWWFRHYLSEKYDGTANPTEFL